MKFKYMLILATTGAVLSANAQVTLPYNPDGDANGLIGVTDLQDLLSTYGGEFAPGTIMVNAVELGELLDSLQSQITALQNESGDAFRCGDDVLHEGYWYNTTSIGGQCWYSENVRYLPEVSFMAWSDSVPHAYVYDWPNGWTLVEGCQFVAHTDVDCAKSTLNYHRFGVLYNFSAVEQWDLCPNGWHVPTDEEWTAMTSSLGSEFFAGNMLKDYSWGGTNLSGFSGLPGGQYGGGGVYQDDGHEGFWWTSSPVDIGSWFGSSAWHRIIGHNGEEDVYRSADKPRRSGFYVRCVRDAE